MKAYSGKHELFSSDTGKKSLDIVYGRIKNSKSQKVLGFQISYLIKFFNNHINHIPKRVLRIICKNYDSSFYDHLNKDNSLAIQQHHLLKLVKEIFKE